MQGAGANAGGANQIAAAIGSGVPVRPGTAVSSSAQGGTGLNQGFAKGAGLASSKGF